MKRSLFLPTTNTQRYALAGIGVGFIFPIVATIIRVLEAGLPLNISSMLAVQFADPLLWIIDTAPFFLGLFAAMAGRRQDALEKVIDELRLRETELRDTQLAVEKSVIERTQELTVMNQLVKEHADQLKSVADTTHSLYSVQELDKLLPLIARTISQKFNYYRVGVYLVDEQKQYAVLQASSNEDHSGSHQHQKRLRIEPGSPVEFVIRNGQTWGVSNTSKEQLFDPELPNTRSELVLPLRSGDIIIGALDLQSDTEKVFSEEYISDLSILSDQVAIAIQNAILHENTQRTLREGEVRTKKDSAKVWSGWVESVRARGYRYDGIRSEPVNEAGAPFHPQEKFQKIPIRLRDRTIGNLKIRFSEAAPPWTEDDRAIAEATAERAALALEGARLLDEAQKRAAREAFLSDMAAKLSTSFQLDSILRDTVEELGQSLKGSTVSFQLVDPSTSTSMDSQQPDEALTRRRNLDANNEPE